jgi:hypothetical protein
MLQFGAWAVSLAFVFKLEAITFAFMSELVRAFVSVIADAMPKDFLILIRSALLV